MKLAEDPRYVAGKSHAAVLHTDTGIGLSPSFHCLIRRRTFSRSSILAGSPQKLSCPVRPCRDIPATFMALIRKKLPNGLSHL